MSRQYRLQVCSSRNTIIAPSPPSVVPHSPCILQRMRYQLRRCVQNVTHVCILALYRVISSVLSSSGES